MTRSVLGFAIMFLLLAANALPLRTDQASISVANAQGIFDRANADYGQDRFQEALDGYRSLFPEGFGTAQVLANAGNAAFRTGDVGQAVLLYVRALRLDPANEVARENLRRIQPTTNVSGDEASFGSVLAAWFGSTPSLAWHGFAEVAFVLLVAAIVLAGRAAPRTDARGAWLSRAAGAAICTVIAALLAVGHADVRSIDGDGVLMETAVSRSGPGEKYFEQVELPPGTLITFKSLPDNGWVEFRLVDGTTGFLPSSSVSAI